ncbi:MAG: hypothetical protein ABR905_14225 [Terracidiphilus sp.]|jgi:hypothetical protein
MYFRDLFRRLRQSYRWIAAQFVLTLLMILIGIAWTRLPEKHVWQVLLSLLLPLLVAISALELQAGTMRSLANDDGKRVKLPWGALSLLFWIAMVWVCWLVLDWCDDQIPQWAGYLNSQAPAHWRAKFLTYQHLSLWMSYIEWVLRWIVVPAKVIPYATASAQCGWRLPVRRVLQLIWNWRWWLGVTIIALVSVSLPGHFYSADPHGTVSAQVWHVSLKLAASYLLGVGGWLLLLAWAGVLFGCQEPLPENDLLTELFERLCASRRWVAAQFGWVLLLDFAGIMVSRIHDNQKWRDWISVPLLLALLVAGIVLHTGMMRSLLSDGGKRVRMIWGALLMLLWAVLASFIAYLLSLWRALIAPCVVGLLVAPAILLPLAAASAMWGLRLPWRRLLQLIVEWRWWLGLIAATVMGIALPALLKASMQGDDIFWKMGLGPVVIGLLAMGSWLLLLGWLAVLFNRSLPHVKEELAEIPALTGPPEPDKQASVKLPLPEGE